MFGISSGADDDEEMSDNSSIPMDHLHFNPAVLPTKRKLGRRRLIQAKETKNVEEAPKQDTQPLVKNSHWSKDDSGILPSDSTPSLTHPFSRTGNANFNAKLGAGTFTSTFTPSCRSNQENKFNKFALPSTPRFRTEPLKEINGVDNSLNQLGNQDNTPSNTFPDSKPSKVSQETAIQKQLNSSFIDESLPVSSGAGNKTANETSDFSNDSSFMTCHDINVQQPNKTVYDPAFLKTPGRNLAEICIDESPFNPLGNFLEESDDFGLRQTPVSSVKSDPSKIKVPLPNNAVNGDESQYSEPLAFLLDCSSVDGDNKNGISGSPPKPPTNSFQNNHPSRSYVKNDVELKNGHQDILSRCQERAYLGSRATSTDNEFKHPSLTLLKTPHRTELHQKEEVREHTTPSSGYVSEKSFHTEETTHVTYPQPSKSIMGQKNTFTSQFSLNSYNPGISNSVKVLSLANQGYEPLSAASLRNCHGVLSSHFDQGYGVQSGRMVHRMGNVRDSRAELDRPLVSSTGQSVHERSGFADHSDELDGTVNSAASERTVVALSARDPWPGGGRNNNLETKQDSNTHASTSASVGNDTTVVAKESHLQTRQQLQVERIRPQHSDPEVHDRQLSSDQAQQNGLYPHQQQQSTVLSADQNLPNRKQFDGQKHSAVQSSNVREHRRPQFGGHQQQPQQNKSLQSDIHQEPQKPQFGGQHEQTRQQSAGQMQSNRPNNTIHNQQGRPQSAGHEQQQESISGPPNGNLVLSALIKPQPQNVITIKGKPYTVLSLLGKGGSSQVYQALGPQSSKLMAIKCVNLASVEEAMATDYLNEIGLLSKLQGCPSVIKLFDHEYVEQSQMLYVVLEKGDIDFSKLIKNISENNQISMPMILYYWSEMLNAVHEIHKRGIIHSDLKPANFLLVEGRLKLIDFGIASSIQGDTTSVMKEVPAGTYNYMSPESLTGPKITRKSDVWSMGCILFNLLYGRTPFSHLNNKWQKLHAIADVNHPVTFPPLKHHAPPSLRLALRWCLNKDPALRPTVEELVTLSELSPPADSGLGKEIDGMMCQYFRRVLPNLRNLKEDCWEHPSK